MNFLVQRYGEKWSMRNIWRRAIGKKPLLKRKKPRVGYFPLPDGKIVSFEEYVRVMGETPDLLEARPPGWDENKEERRVNKKTRNKLSQTILLSSLAFFLVSYGYNQLSLMQDYLHESHLFMQIKYMPDYFNTYGHVQLMAKYGLAAVSAMFVPFLTRAFQDRWILFVTTAFFGIFVSLGFLDAEYTIMPSGFMAGMACLPFSITYSIFMVHVSQRLGDLNQKRPYNGVQRNWILYKFNSYSFFAWYLGFCLSSVTCSYLFLDVLDRNSTYILNTNLTCGKAYCDAQWPNWWDVMMVERDIPSIDKYAYANIVNATFLIIAVALFLFGCLDGQTTKTWTHLKDDKGFEVNFKLGWKAIFNWNNSMLAPIFIFTGWSLDFIVYTYPRAYAICSINSWSFFLGLSGMGGCAAIVSTMSPWLAKKKTGWNPLLIFAVVCFVLCILVLLFWTPKTTLIRQDETEVTPSLFSIILMYVIPILWGIGTGLLHAASQVKIEFEYPDPDKMISMFAVYHHWKAVGIVIGYITRSTSSCTTTKLFALLSTLSAGVLFYIGYEYLRLKVDPQALKVENLELIRFLPNPNPEEMANESDVEEEGTSTSEEEADGGNMKRKKKLIHYRRRPPPNDPRLGKAWRTPYIPPDFEIPRKYITPDGNILIMPPHEQPLFNVQDSYEANVLLNIDTDEVTIAARKVKFQLGYGRKPLFYNVKEILADEREEFRCKFDASGNVIHGREMEPDFYEEDLASNPRHNYPNRIYPALEQLRIHREKERMIVQQRALSEEDDDTEDDDEAPLIS